MRMYWVLAGLTVIGVVGLATGAEPTAVVVESGGVRVAVRLGPSAPGSYEALRQLLAKEAAVKVQPIPTETRAKVKLLPTDVRVKGVFCGGTAPGR